MKPRLAELAAFGCAIFCLASDGSETFAQQPTPAAIDMAFAKPESVGFSSWPWSSASGAPACPWSNTKAAPPSTKPWWVRKS